MINKLKSAVLALVLVGLGVTAANASTNLFLGFVDPAKIVVTYENELRAKDTGTTDTPLFYDHNDIQLKYVFSKYFDVHTDYRLILQNKGKGWNDQSMFLEGFNLKLPEGKWGKLTMNDRVEIGLNSAPPGNTYQLRNFPKYDLPYKWTKFQFQPFVANESFWDLEHNLNFVKNRVYAGFDWQITPKIQGGTWYYRETQSGNNNVANVGVMQIRFIF